MKSLKRDRQSDPLFFIVGLGLISVGLLLGISMGGYIIHEIIWQGKHFPSIIKIMGLLSGILMIVLGAFFHSLVYTDSAEEERMARKIMFPDG